MPLLAQVDPALVQAVAQQLAKEPQSDLQYVVYACVVLVVFVLCCTIYVVKFVLVHTKDIHQGSQAVVEKISSATQAMIEKLTNAFTGEVIAQREQHHKHQTIARDNVHDIRDVAILIAEGKEKEFQDELKKRQDARRPPPIGTA